LFEITDRGRTYLFALDKRQGPSDGPELSTNEYRALGMLSLLEERPQMGEWKLDEKYLPVLEGLLRKGYIVEVEDLG